MYFHTEYFNFLFIKTVKLYSDKYKNEWNDFVDQANNATFLFHRDFMDYHSDRFSDHSLMVYDDDILVALMPANIDNGVIISHQGLTYGGMIVHPKLKFEGQLESFKAILKFLEEEGKSLLKIKLLPSIYHQDDTLQYILMTMGAKRYRTDMLSVVEPEVANYSKDRKAGYKRGVKHGLTVEETDDFKAFWDQILIPNLNQKHNVSPVHSLEEITLLKSRFNQQIRQFNVYHNDVLVAGTTVFETANVAHSQYISGNEEKNTLGSLDFLHIYLLNEVFAEKKYFDFGISNENQGRNINVGLLYWKEGFGAHGVLQNFFEVKTSDYSSLDEIVL